MNYIHRNLEDIISKALYKSPAVLIYGQRMCGKTSLVRNLPALSHYTYIDLKGLPERAKAAEDPAGYIASVRKPVIIDELQYVPELLKCIADYTAVHKRTGDFVLVSSLSPDFLISTCNFVSGSADDTTSENSPAAQETLNGISCFRLTPLSQAEISGTMLTPFAADRAALRQRSSRRKSFDIRGIQKRIIRGSMPAVVNAAIDPSELYNSLLSVCTERDLRLICEYCDPLLFYRFIRAAAAQCGKMLNISQIALDAGINQKQTRDLLKVLEQTGIAFMLYPYSDGSLNRLVKTPKLYFFDTGLACMLTGITDITSSGSFDNIFENYAAAEIAKSFYECGIVPQLWYYRNKDAREINLLMVDDDKLHPVSISRTSEPTDELTLNFSLLDRAKLPRGTGAVICMKQQPDELNDGTLTVPLWAV